MTRQDVAWQEEQTARWYLDAVRGAIPFAAEHLSIMLRLVARGRQPVRRFLDVGSGDGALAAVMLATYPGAEAVLVDFSAPNRRWRARRRRPPMPTGRTGTPIAWPRSTRSASGCARRGLWAW